MKRRSAANASMWQKRMKSSSGVVSSAWRGEIKQAWRNQAAAWRHRGGGISSVVSASSAWRQSIMAKINEKITKASSREKAWRNHAAIMAWRSRV